MNSGGLIFLVHCLVNCCVNFFIYLSGCILSLIIAAVMSSLINIVFSLIMFYNAGRQDCSLGYWGVHCIIDSAESTVVVDLTQKKIKV